MWYSIYICFSENICAPYHINEFQPTCQIYQTIQLSVDVKTLLSNLLNSIRMIFISIFYQPITWVESNHSYYLFLINLNMFNTSIYIRLPLLWSATMIMFILYYWIEWTLIISHFYINWISTVKVISISKFFSRIVKK